MTVTSNLWRVSSSVDISAPPLSAGGRFDLVIIGGGFTGLSAALESARRGASVALLEAESFGFGGSGRNVGLVNAGLWLPPDQVVAKMGEAAGNRLMRELAAGPSKVWSIIERERIECEATPNGTLHLAHSASGLQNLKDRLAQGLARGWPLQLLGAEETARRCGSTAFRGALFDPRAGTIQPLSYARGLAAAAIRAGARLHERARVTRARHDGAGWVVTADGYDLRSRSLLLATNAYFDGIDLGFRPAIVPVSYFQLATAPMPEQLRSEILAGGEGCWDTALVMSSFRTDRAGRMIIGAIGNLEGAGGTVHAAWARRKLAKVYPQLADLPFEHAWRGKIAMTGDHIPKIVAFGPNAYASFGYSGRGICPGTVFGTAIAAALLDATEDGLPVRPVPTHRERAAALQGAYYETGAVLSHAVQHGPLL